MDALDDLDTDKLQTALLKEESTSVKMKPVSVASQKSRSNITETIQAEHM